MGFDYVWAIIEISGIPPTGKKLHQYPGEYTYYPFSHTGTILTVNYALWDLSERVGLTSAPIITFWPTPNVISQLVAGELNPDVWYLIVFSDTSSARTIDPSDVISLSRLPLPPVTEFSDNFSSVGFDVIDMSGLSALTNVGYTANDLTTLSETDFGINKFGLIESSNDSLIFAEFASLAAPEHAPFFPVEVWTQTRGKQLE